MRKGEYKPIKVCHRLFALQWIIGTSEILYAILCPPEMKWGLYDTPFYYHLASEAQTESRISQRIG